MSWLYRMANPEQICPPAKARLAAMPSLFDWLVAKQVVPANPTSSVRCPEHGVKRGKVKPKARRTKAPKLFR